MVFTITVTSKHQTRRDQTRLRVPVLLPGVHSILTLLADVSLPATRPRVGR